MKKPRIRILEKTSITREAVETLVNEIAVMENRRRLINSTMDAQILKIREQHGPELDIIADDLKTKSALVQAWAEANPGEFSTRKSIEFPAGKIGFRTGTPKLKTLPGWTFARVLEKLLAVSWGMAWVRVKQEVDKEGIIASFASGTLQPAELREIGVNVEQDEAFFIEPDLTAAEQRITTQAA